MAEAILTTGNYSKIPQNSVPISESIYSGVYAEKIDSSNWKSKLIVALDTYSRYVYASIDIAVDVTMMVQTPIYSDYYVACIASVNGEYPSITLWVNPSIPVSDINNSNPFHFSNHFEVRLNGRNSQILIGYNINHGSILIQGTYTFTGYFQY